YVHGDPINEADISGEFSLRKLAKGALGVAKGVVKAVKCDPIGSLGVALGVGSVIATGGLATGLGVAALAVGGYTTARSIKKGDTRGAILGAISLVTGGVGTGLNV